MRYRFPGRPFPLTNQAKRDAWAKLIREWRQARKAMRDGRGEAWGSKVLDVALVAQVGDDPGLDYVDELFGQLNLICCQYFHNEEDYEWSK